MERLKKKMNYAEVLQKDELEKREDEALKRKRKKMQRKKRRRKLFFLGVVLLGVFYFISDFSNINVIDITGNIYYSKQQLMDKAKISYHMKSMLVPKIIIENRLENEPLIKNVNVKKTWDGVIRIEVEEEKALGYYVKNDKNYLIIYGEEDINIKDDSVLATIPYVKDLDETQLKNYKKYMKEVDEDIVNMISEVVPHSNSYDKEGYKLVMDDGHIIYTSARGLVLLNSYRDILKQIKEGNRCIQFMEENSAAHASKCQ